MKRAMVKKAPNPVDNHVGGRVKMRRMMLDMSQEKLGDALGLHSDRYRNMRMEQIASAQAACSTFRISWECPCLSSLKAPRRGPDRSKARARRHHQPT